MNQFPTVAAAKPTPTDQRTSAPAVAPAKPARLKIPACFRGDTPLPADDRDAKTEAIGYAFVASDEKAPALRALSQAWLDAASFHPAATRQAAELIAQNLTAVASALQPPAAGRLTAGQRGEGWKAAYGCDDWCVMVHNGDDGNPGWHKAGTFSLVSPKAGGNADPGEVDALLSASVTQVTQDSHIFGTQTRLWLDYGIDTAELDESAARELYARLLRFVPQLGAAIELLAEVARGDIPADEEAKARWHAEQDARAVAERAALAAQ